MYGVIFDNQEDEVENIQPSNKLEKLLANNETKSWNGKKTWIC